MDIRNHTEELERLIDVMGLTNFLDVACTICGEKAGHIEENWQDKRLARKWQAASARFHKFWIWAKATGPL